MGAEFTVRPIGVVRSPQDKMSQGGWARIESVIELEPQYAGGLAGLGEFSHVIVVFALDRAQFELGEHLTRQPRGRADAPRLGVFAQRTKYRPNPLAVTTRQSEPPRSRLSSRQRRRNLRRKPDPHPWCLPW